MDSMGEDVDSGEKIDREPRMHIMADLRSKKFSLQDNACAMSHNSYVKTLCHQKATEGSLLCLL